MPWENDKKMVEMIKKINVITVIYKKIAFFKV